MRLRDIAYVVPGSRISSKEIAEWSGLGVAFIEEKIGVLERAFLAPNETQVNLAADACRELFRRNPELDPAAIQLLIMVTQNPDYRIPHSSALLQDALSLPMDIPCFDVSLGCSGYVYGLSIAKGLMKSEGLSNALLVTCDPYSRIVGREDRDTVSLFGDAASASWLSAEKGATIGISDFGTDGSGGHNLMVRGGGSAYPLSGINNDQPVAAPSRDFRLQMNGHAIFNFMMQRIPGSVERCLERNKMSRQDIECYVFHQASKFLLDTLARKMRLDSSKVPCNLKLLGNTVSSSIPILLSQLKDEGRLAGRNVLVCGFGVGLSWASNVLSFGGSNDG